MIDIESIIEKIRRLPEPLAVEVNDFVDSLLRRKRPEPMNPTLPLGHPIMRAYGLWQGERDLDDLTERIYANRHAQSSRPEVSL